MIEIDKLYELAHKDYQFRKNEILTKLICIRDSNISNDVTKIWLSQAIEFIKEEEI